VTGEMAWPPPGGNHPSTQSSPSPSCGERRARAAGWVKASHGSAASASRARPNPFFPASGTNHPLSSRAQAGGDAAVAQRPCEGPGPGSFTADVAEHCRPEEQAPWRWRGTSRQQHNPARFGSASLPTHRRGILGFSCLGARPNALGKSRCWGEIQQEGAAGPLPAGHLKRARHCCWRCWSVAPHCPFQLLLCRCPGRRCWHRGPESQGDRSRSPLSLPGVTRIPPWGSAPQGKEGGR